MLSYLLRGEERNRGGHGVRNEEVQAIAWERSGSRHTLYSRARDVLLKQRGFEGKTHRKSARRGRSLSKVAVRAHKIGVADLRALHPRRIKEERLSPVLPKKVRICYREPIVTKVSVLRRNATGGTLPG